MRTLKEAKVVFIDWSGVVSDDRRPVYEANARMIESKGFQRSTFEEWLRQAKGNPVDLFRSLGIPCTEAELYTQYQQVFPQVRNEGIRPIAYPEALPFLKNVSESRRVIVVSSHPTPFLREEAIEYGVDRYLHAVHGSELKKAQAIVRALKNERIRPHEAIFVGDMTHDIYAGHEARVRTIGVTTGYHPRETLAVALPYLI